MAVATKVLGELEDSCHIRLLRCYGRRRYSQPCHITVHSLLASSQCYRRRWGHHYEMLVLSHNHMRLLRLVSDSLHECVVVKS